MNLPDTIQTAVEALEHAQRRNTRGVTIHADLLESLLSSYQLLSLAMQEAFDRLEAQNASTAAETNHG